MKRDMELVRLILQAIEGSEDAGTKMMERSIEERGYHISLLVDAGLLIAKVHTDGDKPIGYFISRMTWAGHDFLDSMRDDTIWKKAKEHVIIPGASWTFDILKEWAKHELKQRLSLPE